MDAISGKDERHADRKAPAILSHKDGTGVGGQGHSARGGGPYGRGRTGKRGRFDILGDNRAVINLCWAF